MRRQIKPPQRYVNDAFVAHALSVININEEIIVKKSPMDETTKFPWRHYSI